MFATEAAHATQEMGGKDPHHLHELFEKALADVLARRKDFRHGWLAAYLAYLLGA